MTGTEGQARTKWLRLVTRLGFFGTEMGIITILVVGGIQDFSPSTVFPDWLVYLTFGSMALFLIAISIELRSFKQGIKV